MSETPQIKFKAGRENEWISVAPVSNGEFDCWLRLKLQVIFGSLLNSASFQVVYFHQFQPKE